MGTPRYAELRCSIARTLDIVGERWTLLVLRDLHGGITRFDAIQANLGISRKVLAERLAALEEHAVIERVAYQRHPPRHDYMLTDKGRELGALLLAMIAWGDRWTVGDDGPPALLRHVTCGADVQAVPACSGCGEPLVADEVMVLRGPGAAPGSLLQAP